MNGISHLSVEATPPLLIMPFSTHSVLLVLITHLHHDTVSQLWFTSPTLLPIQILNSQWPSGMFRWLLQMEPTCLFIAQSFLSKGHNAESDLLAFGIWLAKLTTWLQVLLLPNILLISSRLIFFWLYTLPVTFCLSSFLTLFASHRPYSPPSSLPLTSTTHLYSTFLNLTGVGYATILHSVAVHIYIPSLTPSVFSFCFPE